MKRVALAGVLCALAVIGFVGTAQADGEQPWWETCNELPASQIEACFYEHNGEEEPSEAEDEREILLANGCAHTNLEFRPHAIGISCDRTFKFYGIHWKRWGRPEAIGVGHARLQGCTPACANGEVTRPRAKIRLTHVVAFEGILMYARLTYALIGPLPEGYRGHRGILHVLPGSSNMRRRPRMKECPTSGVMDLGQLQALGTSCAHATRVIGSFMGKSQLRGRSHLRTLGFRCKNVEPGNGPGIICRRGRKMARFLGAPDFWIQATARSARRNQLFGPCDPYY